MTDDVDSPAARSRRSRRRRRLWLTAAPAATIALAVGATFLASWHVQRASDGFLYDVDDAPEILIAMVLGAQADPRGPSPFLAARLDLAVQLWERGAIRAVLVSGDNADSSNNETTAMKAYLVDRGIPETQIVEDPAGFDTYESCVRAKDMYGVQELIVLTQDFHLPRAVTLCRAVGIDAVGVGDSTVRVRFPDVYQLNAAREILARVKMEWTLLVRPDVPTSPFDPSLSEAAAR